jgi:hypothetical protein
MGKVFVFAFFASIAGLVMGMVLGNILADTEAGKLRTDGKTGDRLIFAVFTMTGWGAGGIIGAIAGIGHILQGRNQSKSPN